MKHLAVAALLLSAVLLNSDSDTPNGPVATYSHGALHVKVGHGTGQLAVEVLSPENEAIGTATSGGWQADVKLARPLSTEDLVWHRLHYRFTPSDGTNPIEGTASISQILRTPVVHIIGQQSFLAGGEAAVRVAATDLRNEPISGDGSVNVELRPAGKSPIVLFSGRLNRRGTAEVQFRLPAGITGKVPLVYAVQTAIGGADYTQEIRIEPKSSVLLTTEKPIYQPGQTIHVRALALDRVNHQATARSPITFEIEDSKGNKVFKRSTQTDSYGIASAEFTLADEVNLGMYHLRAAMDGNTAEIALNVDRYVLPKFKVAVEFSGASKHGYRPGDHVAGTVRAHYFFGEPVSGRVTVKASAMDVEMFEAATAQGELGADGAYKFDLKLPDYFAGRPLDQGAARVLVEASVKDSAGHEETRGEPVTVSQSPLLITAVPEGGTLVPNLENEVFVLASYPDGTPAPASVRAAGQTVNTDAGGVALIRLKPGVQPEKLQIEASDREGNRATANVTLAARGGADQVLLRTERAVYRAGEPVRLHVFSTKARGTVYVDVVKSGQTVLTRDVDLSNGQADLTLTATPDLAGTLDCNAYLFGADARPVADHRLLFVQPADELKIEATTDRPVYKPGEDAKVRFRVTNSHGEGVQAALGVQVVDEAVFALAEKQPGFAKVFFYLEQEVMKPRYEIHGLDMAGAVTDAKVLPARALFAATEMVNPNRFETEVGRTAPMGKFAAYQQRYQSAFVALVKKLVQGTTDPMGGPVLMARDAWGTRLRVQGGMVTSAGPDQKFGTADDLRVFVNTRTKDVVAAPEFNRLERFAVMDGGPRVMAVMGAMAQPVPMARFAATDSVAVTAAAPMVMKAETGGGGGAAPATHVRSYFPEALYINPEIVTDGRGNATVAIPLADSITTWRMALTASTARGALGSGASSIKVFQDFFVDLDLPVTLTQGDRVSIPVGVYNYSGAGGEVGLQLQAADWYGMAGDSAGKTVKVEAGKVGGASFGIEAKRIGKFKLRLAARLSAGHGPAPQGGRQDVVVREIEVVPNGRELTTVFNGRLDAEQAHVNIRPGIWQEADWSVKGGVVQHSVVFPAGAIPDASKVFVRLYPGPLSQVIEGMDAILRMPFGCFEQTSSATYPNVLALDYMKRMKKLTPEVHAKAEGFITNGYQRLLTYEVPGGGFSWFGNPPANKILTSYGLMEFHDMAQVHDVDPKLIQRTQQWLAGQQQADGSWKPDTEFINEGATNRFNTDVLRITAYIGWALSNTEYRGPAVEKARQYVEGHLDARADAYTLAVAANFLQSRRVIELLMAAKSEKDDLVWWTARETGMYSTGASAAVETTGLAVQALLKAGMESATASKALKFIASKKDASGTWGTTQATIMALRAVLLSTEKGAADVSGTVEITLNGRPAGTLTLTADNNDLLHQFALAGVDERGANRVELRFTGKGGLAYQVAGRYFLPWDARTEAEPLTIDVQYDRTSLAQNDVATATATVKSNLRQTAKMVMVDLGIPPGFELLAEDLEAYKSQSAAKASGRMEKFSMTATQALLYFDSIAAGDTVKLKYRLRANYPIRAKTFASRVYEYYDPSVGATARPVQMEVRGK